MARAFAEVSYTLTNLIVAAYNAVANTYGTPEVVEDGQMLVSEPEADQDKLRGYGQYTHGLSVTIGAKVQIKGGGFDFSALAIMAGITATDSGTTPNRKRTVKVPAGGAGLPYFGVIGVGATDDGGVAVVGLQKVLLDAVPKYTLDGEGNKFNVSEAAGYAFPVGGFLEWIIDQETAANWTAPASGANFLAFFS